MRMENKNEESCETVTLILKAERFEVEKQKLTSKSLYFTALLSANYSECNQTEHIINYDISQISLQDFINWIHSDKIDTSTIYYGIEEFDRLLVLLELSVLFAVDNLIEDVIDRLERHYMSPKYVINIWLISQDLNINVLRDLSLAVCLDRFDELPISSIYELSRENFLKLLGNINIRSTESYLFHVTHEWMNHHCDFTIPMDILRNKEIKVLHSIISCESSDVINSEQFIHCWDGNDFFELTSFKYPKDITDRSIGKNILTGMQIIARGYNLYLCGGEFGIGSGRFNKNVWRYSLISKKWFLETVMPIERRHMVAVFLKNKLMLVGGVGRYRQKLQSIDIYDVHTGLWTSGKKMDSWEFTTVPEHYVFDGKLIIYKYQYIIHQYINTLSNDISDDHITMPRLIIWADIYFPDENVWETKMGFNMNYYHHNQSLPILTLKTLPCYIDINNPDEMILRTITETCNVERCDHVQTIKRLVFENENDSNRTYVLHTKCDAYLSILIFPTCMRVLVCMDSNTSIKINTLHLHNIPIRNPNKFRSLLFSHSPRKFFDLIHPAHLHTTNLNYI
ncbi:kelch repeat and BTB domain-containing protein 12 isoform X2 [Mycetomoellerius zeteki]|uniref:kelch repeat and BTB domain-containing protein 12 isoform X2 n=1 Tax=Mycetomoellerius zeteki TaxID=64791 RepID=UPI00084EC27D|nr:PREDICTED: kelch repeat and BTB domain-containing protein 12-like isoform X2 [Trachymyrmex zeteki]